MKFKPYYLVQAYSAKVKKQQTQFLETEMALNKRLMSLIQARSRSKEYAASLNEAKSMGATDWTPIVRLVTDTGEFIVDLNAIPVTKP